MPSLNDLASPLNGLVERLLDSPLHFVASKSLVVIRWSGKKSGKRFSIPAGYQPEADNDALFVMISQRDEKNWWKNFRSPWPADLLIRGELRSAMGEVIAPGSSAFFACCEQTLTRLPWMGSQFGRIKFDPEAGLSQNQRQTLEQNVGAVRFELVD